MASAVAAVSLPGAGAVAFKFTGQAGEYFRIWIVNICLSVVTLGIYSAWAKVRRKRYFYGCAPASAWDPMRSRYRPESSSLPTNW